MEFPESSKVKVQVPGATKLTVPADIVQTPCVVGPMLTGSDEVAVADGM